MDPLQEVQEVEDISQVLHVVLHIEHCPLFKKPVLHERHSKEVPGDLQVRQEGSQLSQVFLIRSFHIPLGQEETQLVPDRKEESQLKQLVEEVMQVLQLELQRLHSLLADKKKTIKARITIRRSSGSTSFA